MTPLRQQMIEAMQLRGLAQRTRESYLAAVRQVAEHYGKSPALLSQEELRQYFLYLQQVKQVAPSTCNQTLAALKFLFFNTLQQDCPILTAIKFPQRRAQPVVLSRAEVQQILRSVRQAHHRVCLSTIYGCGLRLLEGVSLQVGDIDSGRMLLHVRQGKGGRDRRVPLPEKLLKLLRQHWCTHRHPRWLFPGRGVVVSGPMNVSSVQKAFRAALKQSGVSKGASVHSLRHAWATHLLEAGVSLPLLQQYLGHQSLSTTARYTHLTELTEQQTAAAIEQLTDQLG